MSSPELFYITGMITGAVAMAVVWMLVVIVGGWREPRITARDIERMHASMEDLTRAAMNGSPRKPTDTRMGPIE